jgi:hypothetical protein
MAITRCLLLDVGLAASSWSAAVFPTISDGRVAPRTRSKSIIAVAVALFNSLYLAASALGLLQT